MKQCSGKLKPKIYSLVALALFLTAVVLLNVFTGLLTERFFIKADLTDTDLYTLSDKAAGFLAGIDESIDIVVLDEESVWLSNNVLVIIIDILRNYSAMSGGHIRVQFVNPDLNYFDGPAYNNSLAALRDAHAELDGMTRGDIVFISSRRATRMSATDLFMHGSDAFGRPVLTGIRADQELVSAMTRVLSERVAHAVFIENHQEDPSEYLKLYFNRNGYITSSVNLALEDIPEDTVILISAAPKYDFLSYEIIKLEQFLAYGGNVIILHDFNTQSLPVLESFFAEWGIIVEDKLVFDETHTYIPQMGVIGAHVTAGPLPSTTEAEIFTTGQIPVGVPMPRPLSPVWADGVMGGISLHPLISTFSASSYAKDTSGGGLTTWERETGDASGPFILAYNARRLTRDTDGSQVYSNLIVAGAEMFSDSFLSVYGGTFYNALLISNLANDFNPFGESIFIPSKSLTDSHMLVSAAGARTILLVMVIALPLLILSAGVFVWRKRRHL